MYFFTVSDHSIDGVNSIMLKNFSNHCWLGAATAAMTWAFKTINVPQTISPFDCTPRDGFEQAILAWSRIQSPAIVKSELVLDVYLAFVKKPRKDYVNPTLWQSPDQLFFDLRDVNTQQSLTVVA